MSLLYWIILTWIILTVSSSSQVVSGATTEKDNSKTCMEVVKSVLEQYSPEVLIEPPNGNTTEIATDKIQTTIKWDHIYEKFTDKSCIQGYFIQYGQESEKYKRETITTNAFALPTVDTSITNQTVYLDDGCSVYYVHLTVIPLNLTDNYYTSKLRKFWLPAYRTVISLIYDAAVVALPTECVNATHGWEFEACPKDVHGRCSIARLHGHSPFALNGLETCRTYSFRLRSGPKHIGEFLWSFPTENTLPKLQVELTSNHESIDLKVYQLFKCDKSLMVPKLIVTHCLVKGATRESILKQFYNTESHSENQDPEDDEYDLVYEFYQYDEGNHSDIHSDYNRQEDCNRTLYDLDLDKPEITIQGLAKCTLYKLDVGMVDRDGRYYLSDNFRGNYPTLCNATEDGGQTHFEDHTHEASTEIPENNNNTTTTTSPYQPMSPGLIALTTILCILILGAMVIVAVRVFFKKRQEHGVVRHVRCPSEDEGSIIISLR